jgi:hypothetical protein
MTRKNLRRAVWSLFIGAVVGLLAAKTPYSRILASLDYGVASAAYVFAFLYAINEQNIGARFLRGCLVTVSVLYVAFLITGLEWTLIPWGAGLFAVTCIFFLKKNAAPSKKT